MKTLFKALLSAITVLVVAFGLSWLIFMPNASERGVWRAEAGGMVLNITRTTAKTYRQTSISCIEELTFPAHLKFVEWAEGAWLETEGDALLLHLDGSVDPTRFTRLEALPENCGPATPETATPREVFDVLWTAMDENYAFFDLHGVNWQARRSLAPAQNAEMTDADLFDLLMQTLDGLDDGHVHLGTYETGFASPSQPPAWLPDDGSLTRANLIQTARDTLGTPLTPLPEAPIEFALLEGNIGYVLIREMDVDVPFGGNSQSAMTRAFGFIAEVLGDTRALIIDLRYNPGGSDTVSFGVASHFTATPLTAFTKSSRIDAGQTTPFTATLQPFDDTPLTQPTLILTSQLTGSAAEILTMTLRELPQVTIMGEATGGGLSDVLGFVLPNGWLFGLSNQTYLTPSGEAFEGIGIPPDIPFEITAEPLLTGQDPLLEAAIAQAATLP